MATFRDPVARDRAWARYYSQRGLRGVVDRRIRSIPNPFRFANYLLRRAKHDAAVSVCERTVQF